MFFGQITMKISFASIGHYLTHQNLLFCFYNYFLQIDGFANTRVILMPLNQDITKGFPVQFN